MFVKNKWNNNLYEVIDNSKNKVVLKRCSNGVVLTITKSEHIFSYKPYEKTQ